MMPNKTHYPLPVFSPPKTLEHKICHDAKAADLSKWLNNGWETTHMQFVGKKLHVVLQRTVLVSPPPKAEEPTPVVIEPEPKAAEPTPVVIEPDTTQDIPVVTAFETALRSDADPATVMALGDAAILRVARQAYDAHRATHIPQLVPLLEMSYD